MQADPATVAGQSGLDGFEAFFLEAASGRLFCTYRAGRVSASASRGSGARAVLVLPPFAEEMNKARRMLALFAQRAQAAGISVLIPDLHGTGDSDGEFGNATLETWSDDIRACADWLAREAAAPLSALALRFGALQAGSLPTRLFAGGQLVLWQPATSGRLLVNQFLRLKLAGQLLAGTDAQGDMAALRQDLKRAGSLEVAGYTVRRELVESIESLELSKTDLHAFGSITAFEIAATDAPAVSPALSRALDVWRRQGAAVASSTVAGDPFWATTEIAIVPRLLDATIERFMAGGASR